MAAMAGRVFILSHLRRYACVVVVVVAVVMDVIAVFMLVLMFCSCCAWNFFSFVYEVGKSAAE